MFSIRRNRRSCSTGIGVHDGPESAFTGRLREYVASALENQFKAEPNDLHRRAYVLGVYREEYTAYEDLGAYLEAFLTNAEDHSITVMERLLRYGPGDVKLAKVLERRNIKTGDDLFGH